jgi:hypothetical protein
VFGMRNAIRADLMVSVFGVSSSSSDLPGIAVRTPKVGDAVGSPRVLFSGGSPKSDWVIVDGDCRFKICLRYLEWVLDLVTRNYLVLHPNTR